MAAGLGFKTFTTGEVLTSADTNGYLMQGVLVFASAAARDAAITSPQEGQFAYLKDTNVTTYYTGSAWANLDTTGMTNPMTTTGDTIYSSSGSTPARLGIGTVGQVLTVNSGATAPEWATAATGGGLTLLSTTTFANTVTNFTVSSISGSYKNLLIVGSGLQTNTASTGPIQLQFNADTGANYTAIGIRNNAGTIQSDGTIGDTSYQTGTTFGYSADTAARFGSFQLIIYNYASTSLYKTMNSQAVCGGNGSLFTNTYAGNWQNNTTAITSIKFTNATSANFKAGSIQIYGVS
jgi:hypothetical protein